MDRGWGVRLTVSMLDEIQNTFRNGKFSTGCLCVRVGVKCRICEEHTNDMGGKLDAECTALFCLVSL